MRMARNIYHRKDGRFEGRYVKAFGDDGRKKYGSVFGKSYAEVKEKLEGVIPASPTTHATATKSQVTVASAVAARIESLKNSLKPSTEDSYNRYFENHIAPYFGNTSCDRLTPEML